MKSKSSLLTQSTKMSYLTLVDADGCQPQLITIFTKQNGKIYQTQMSLLSQSIATVISSAIQQFNVSLQLNLSTDLSSYLLYAARKNGKICSDYPPFQNDQDVSLTKIFNFYLKHKKPVQIQLNRIQTNFSHQVKKEVKSRNTLFCSCMFSS